MKSITFEGQDAKDLQKIESATAMRCKEKSRYTEVKKLNAKI